MLGVLGEWLIAAGDKKNEIRILLVFAHHSGVDDGLEVRALIHHTCQDVVVSEWGH